MIILFTFITSLTPTHHLKSKLNKAGYDCVFLEGPHLLPLTSTVQIEGVDVQVENGKRENARAWFLLSDTDPADASESQSGRPLTYFGINEALHRVQHELEHEETFVALMGFSQGGVFAHILSRLADAGHPPFNKIRAAILASAFAAQHMDKSPSRPYSHIIGNMPDRKTITLPSLHIIGKNDTSVRPTLSEDLSLLFNDRQFLFHEKGHILPQTSDACQTMIGFLDEVADS
jgi:predicted esterase